MGAGETTTLAHLRATHKSWPWARMTAYTHWSQRIHQTHECHSCSAFGRSLQGAEWQGGTYGYGTQVETWPAVYTRHQPRGVKKEPA